MVDRSFKCGCCQKTVMFDSRFQCLVCPKISICKMCFKGRYHDHHSFIFRQTPGKDWQIALRESMKQPMGSQEESEELYKKVMEELQKKEISTEAYE